ncbi:unnamed protein product [Polarella glacialis]|uniref:Sulfotransferase domain-containing protein n=1 Tax=Polarella glacialis TaxID=89957 RepID=A0A813H374_POLGL|nr:unnamed protein product [Polarella glacialis]
MSPKSSEGRQALTGAAVTLALLGFLTCGLPAVLRQVRRQTCGSVVFQVQREVPPELALWFDRYVQARQPLWLSWRLSLSKAALGQMMAALFVKSRFGPEECYGWIPEVSVHKNMVQARIMPFAATVSGLCSLTELMASVSGFPSYAWPGIDQTQAWDTVRSITDACIGEGGVLWRVTVLHTATTSVRSACLPMGTCKFKKAAELVYGTMLLRSPLRSAPQVAVTRDEQVHGEAVQVALRDPSVSQPPELVLQELSDWRELVLDFVIPGMAKAGTTWLARQLSRHQDIHIHGFAVHEHGEEFPFDAEEMAYWPAKQHVSRWNRLHYSNRTLVGVKHPGYLQKPWVMQVLSYMGTKIIALLRNPVDLCYSLYLDAFRSSDTLGPRPSVSECVLGAECRSLLRAKGRSRHGKELTKAQTFSTRACRESFSVSNSSSVEVSLRRAKLQGRDAYIVHTSQLQAALTNITRWLGLRSARSFLAPQPENTARQNHAGDPDFLLNNDLCASAAGEALTWLREVFAADEEVIGQLLTRPLDAEQRGEIAWRLPVTASGKVRVFGVHVFGSRDVEPWALQHSARALAKFLDQDEDGMPDTPKMVQEMARHKAAVLLLRNKTEYELGPGQVTGSLAHGVIKNDLPAWNCSVTDVWVIVELFQDELVPEAAQGFREQRLQAATDGREDATWEELIHLITHTGLGCAFPDRWGFRADAEHPNLYPPSAGATPASELSAALDAAIGSCGVAYSNSQEPKAEGCSYYYEDQTCFYPCLVNEYLYQVWRTRIGGRDSACAGVLKAEYSFCTQALLEAKDPAGFKLAGDPMLPKQLPSGSYRPDSLEYASVEHKYGAVLESFNALSRLAFEKGPEVNVIWRSLRNITKLYTHVQPIHQKLDAEHYEKVMGAIQKAHIPVPVASKFTTPQSGDEVSDKNEAIEQMLRSKK